MKNGNAHKPASITSQRLVLRPFGEQDEELLRELFMDPAVMKYLPWGHPYSDSETARRLQQLLVHWQRYHFGTYAIRPKGSQQSIGYAGLETVNKMPLVELLYALSRKYWRQGYAFEAAAACVQFGFDSVGLPLIVGVCAPGNHGSKRIMEKLGMKPAPDLDFYGKRLLYYSLSREEYAANLKGAS